MQRLRFSRAAQRDFKTIARYIADRSGRGIANAVILRLRQRCERLAALPGLLGTARPELAVGLRSTPHRGYILYFRYVDDTIEIVNVLDARRDATVHFAEEDPET